MGLNSRNLSAISFNYLQENEFHKVISLFSSCLLTILCIPLFYSFIWYERFGSDNRRTLINQLVSFIWKIFIFYFVVVRIFDTINLIVGSFPQWFCITQSFLKGACATAVLITIDAVMVTRYIFNFNFFPKLQAFNIHMEQY